MLVVGVVLEIVLAVFATRTGTSSEFSSAATLMRRSSTLVTVRPCDRAAKSRREGSSSRPREWPVIIVSRVWLVFVEPLIFADRLFTDPWSYLGHMFADRPG